MTTDLTAVIEAAKEANAAIDRVTEMLNSIDDLDFEVPGGHDLDYEVIRLGLTTCDYCAQWKRRAEMDRRWNHPFLDRCPACAAADRGADGSEVVTIFAR